MSKTAKKRLFTLLRVVICVAALAWVLHGVTLHDYVTLEDGTRLRLLAQEGQTVTVMDRQDQVREMPQDRFVQSEDGGLAVSYGMITAWEQSDKRLLVAAFLLFGPVTFLQSWRFQIVFRAQEIGLSYWESIKLCFAGNFLNWVMPIGSTAGDVFKAYHVAVNTRHKTEALTTILLDRLIGLGGLLILVGIAIEVGAQDPVLRGLGHLICAGIVAAALGLLVFTSQRARNKWLPRKLLDRLPEGISSQIRRVDGATQRLVRHRRIFGGSIVCTLVLQFIALSSVVLAAYALGMDFSDSKVFDYYACIGTGVVVAAVPISFQGLGTSEAVYRQFMLGSHGTLAQLLFMAMSLRLLQLGWALPGALVALTGSYKLQPDAGDLVSAGAVGEADPEEQTTDNQQAASPEHSTEQSRERITERS